MRKVLLATTLAVSSVFADSTDALFRAYANSINRVNNVLKSTSSLDINDEFIRAIYNAFVAANMNIDGEYRKKTWLFENTLAFLGTFTEAKARSIDFATYQSKLRTLSGILDAGKVQNFSDATADGAIESRIIAYYRAVAIGVLAGIGPGYIPFPGKEQGDMYGAVAVPVYNYRVSMQALRTSVLTSMIYRVVYNKAELATLYFFANSYCRGLEKQEATKRVATRPEDAFRSKAGEVQYDILVRGSGTLRYEPVVAAIKDLKVALLAASDALASQGSANATFTCLSILTQLHNTKALIDFMELALYNLSAQYGILASMEKSAARR